MNVQVVSEFYKTLNQNNLDTIGDIYHEDVQFQDPLHEIQGIENLYNYFSELYRNVKECRFYISRHQQTGSIGFIVWEMSLLHPKLDKDNPVVVHGCSHLEFYQGKILYQRDYFDAGEMIYEQLPFVSSVIKSIKKRVGK